ncbi:hypothetical protein ACSBR1_039970 [Camellia fascicularis]
MGNHVPLHLKQYFLCHNTQVGVNKHVLQCIRDSTNMQRKERKMEWILEQWDKNYYFTSLAGASNGSALVVYIQGENSEVDLFSILALSLVLERRKTLRTG